MAAEETQTHDLRVTHVVGHAIERSETFIQRRLVGRRYEPSVLTWALVPGGLTVPCPVRLIWPPEDGPLGQRFPKLARLARHGGVLAGLLRGRPNVVHAHFGSVGMGILRETRALRLPLITSFYGYEVGTIPREPGGLARLQALFNGGTAFTAEGPALARRMMELGARPESVKLLPLCLPAWAMARPERAVDWRAPELRLLQVARFAEKKGIDLTLRALGSARRRGVPATLTLVGDGDQRPELERIAAEQGLGDAVSWLGFRPYDELPGFLSRSHVFIQPSRTAAGGDTEGGHPTTLIEAQAQGVPVIGSLHADIPFAVRHGETGLLAPENDVEAVADAIVRLHASRDLLVAMSERARTLALRRHDPERLRILRERIYREASRTGPRPRSTRA